VIAALLAGSLATAGPAAATELPPAAEQEYAAILRTINPQLQAHQSLAYARSLLADAARSKLDPNLVMALVTVESAWRPSAISASGARGLGQLMPSTAARLGVNPRDPSQNLRGATTYLRRLVNRFADRGLNALRDAIGAYNAGPLAVQHSHGLPPGSSRRYVDKVIAQWHRLSVRVAATFLHDGMPGVAPAPGTIPDERQWLENAAASALPASASPAPAADAPSAPSQP